MIAGIGVTPNIEWLEGSGLQVDGGVVTDAAGRSSLPDVWAAGDVAYFFHPLYDAFVRVHHWTNAIEQGRVVGLNIATGTDTPYRTVPYFWTDMFERKYHYYGRRRDGDDSLLGRPWVPTTTRSSSSSSAGTASSTPSSRAGANAPCAATRSSSRRARAGTRHSPMPACRSPRPAPDPTTPPRPPAGPIHPTLFGSKENPMHRYQTPSADDAAYIDSVVDRVEESLDDSLLPVDIFNDDRIFAAEMQRIFTKTWCSWATSPRSRTRATSSCDGSVPTGSS